MKLKSATLILLPTVLFVLIVACGDSNQLQPTEIPTATAEYTPTLIPIVPSTPTPPPWGLLTSLPVKASDVLAAGALLDKSINQSDENRSFRGFGMPKSGNPESVSPQWEFAVPPGAPALAPVTGYVVEVHTLWSDDLSVWLSADGKESRVWEVEHVIDVLVEVGDFVETGQPIATASVFGGREIALVELELFQGGRPPTHYCPLLYLDEDASHIINTELADIRKENFDRLTGRGISIPANDLDGQSC